MLKVSGDIVQNLVGWATRYPEFVHPWITSPSESYRIVGKYLIVPGIKRKIKLHSGET